MFVPDPNNILEFSPDIYVWFPDPLCTDSYNHFPNGSQKFLSLPQTQLQQSPVFVLQHSESAYIHIF